MAATSPDWLKQHDGEVRSSKTNVSASVYIGGQLRYVLVAVPAKGKYACRVTETVNGKRLDGPSIHGTADEAIKGGLDDLKNALGW